MRTLYDEIEPYERGALQVSPVHTLYYEQSGAPDGIPAVFVHGGPGAGTIPDHRRYFDPGSYRIVVFDQRGAGKSTPHASLDENTTWHLVEDLEKLRERLGVDKWLVFGGSWGSTLSLAYAETHPDRVLALVLRGIFLCRKKEIRWFYQQGADAIFPDLWEKFRRVIPEDERGDMVSAFYRRLTSDDEAVRLEAARAWSTWEGGTLKLVPDQGLIDHFNEPQMALSLARIESHYFMNDAFFDTDNFLIENVHKIRHIPAAIVQGRYDVVCPAASAWDLHNAWPEARFVLVPDAGHAATEPGIVDALVQATDDYRDGLLT
jgi:proline iminopeptidase